MALVRKILETTLSAGSTSVTFSDSDIPNSLLRVYTTKSDLFPLSQTISGNNLTVNYEAQTSNVGVALEIVKQGLTINDTLTSDATDQALSAKQGKTLKTLIDGITVPGELADLSDVDLTNIQDGQVLAWSDDDQKFINVNQSGGSSSLDDLTDVVITSVVDDQCLVYDNGDWVNKAVPSGDIVTWTQLVSTGEKIAEIDINGTATDVYAPQGGTGGGSSVTITTTDSTLYGATVTLSDGTTTLTTTFSNSGEAAFSGVTMTGSLTVACGGDSMIVSVPYFGNYEFVFTTIPEGSTVLPTDDIQTWLACAGITDKSYTTLNEVLADSTTLLALISDNNASDYLVRSTTWVSGLTADSTAMTDIGANNYCADTLLSDSTWRNAICNSTYFESVLNVKVPTMTSNTTPSGECFATDTTSGSYPYLAFDGNESSYQYAWTGTAYVYPNAIGYHFPTSVVVHAVQFQNRNYASDDNCRIKTYKIQGSNDKFVNDVHDLTDLITRDASKNVTKGKDFIVLENNTTYSDYRIYITASFNNVSPGADAVQFYGRAS